MEKSNTAYIPNSPEGIIETLQDIRNQISVLKDKEDDFKSRLVAAFQTQLSSAYKEKPEPFGVVNFKEGSYKLSFTTPKKVKWDQVGLEALYNDGAPVEVEYNVKETIYKDLNDAGKEILNKYRTVEPGSITIKIERV